MSAEPAIDTDSAYYELIKPLSFRRKFGLAVEILSDYIRVRRLLGRSDLPTTVTKLRDTASIGAELEGRRAQAVGVRLGKAVGRTLGVLPFDSRCLVRSLVLLGMLARRGVGATLVIGVSIEPEFRAHAWIESDGISLLPPMDDSYRRLVEL